MNVQKVRYALEVWKSGSISKAAENLFIDQANLSRAIRQLESEYNIRLFTRMSTGVEITSEGMLFLREAANLIENVETFDQAFKESRNKPCSCRIATMDTTYVAMAVTESLSTHRTQSNLKLEYYETNDTLEIINRVANRGYHFGIIRQERGFEDAYRKILKDKQLESKEIMTFSYKVLINKNNPLAGKDIIDISELKEYNCLLRGDNTKTKTIEGLENSVLGELVGSAKNLITLYGRGSQYDFLRNVPNTYMIVSPIPEEVLLANGLVQIEISNVAGSRIKDLLIMQSGYQPGRFESDIITTIMDYGRKLEQEGLSELKEGECR